MYEYERYNDKYAKCVFKVCMRDMYDMFIYVYVP